MPHPTPHVWKRNGLPSARELPVPYSRRGRHHLAMSQRSNSQTPAALRGRIAYTSRSHPLLTMHEFSFSLRGRWRRVDRNATSSSAIVTETRPGFMGQRFATRTGPRLCSLIRRCETAPCISKSLGFTSFARDGSVKSVFFF